MTSTPEPITEADVDDLVKLFDSAGPYVTARGRSDYWLYARLFNNTCLCIRDNGRPVAAIIAFRDQTEGVHEIYIQDVAVDTNHRQQGLAQALLEELHHRARTWGIKRIWLTSEAENTNAMRLWQRLGYRNPDADYQVDGVWMTKNLKGPRRDRAVYELRP
jgi:ribosomal protein S18 acetylase RimI-like enzyme